VVGLRSVLIVAASFAVFLMLFGCAGAQQETQEQPQPSSTAPAVGEQSGSSPTQPSLPPQQGMPFGGNPDAPQQYPTGGQVLPPQDGQAPQQNPQGGAGVPAQNGEPQPGSGQPWRAPANPNAPLPGQPPGAPEGKWMGAKLGGVQVKYFSTAIARGMMESGTDYFITLNNTGSSAARICAPACCSELRSFAPSWNLHFFALQDFPVELAPEEAKKLWYFASLDQTGLFNVTFRMWECGNEGNAVSLPVTFGATDERFWGNETSYVQGTVKDEEGKPVAGATVVAMTGCGRADSKGQSDSQGKYTIPVLGMEDVEAIYLGRDLACSTKDYWLSVEKEGYEYYYASGFAPTRGAPATEDIVLRKKAEGASYELAWEKKVQDNFGFFWVKPSADWSVFAAAQAKHPPELNKPTNFYLFDANGNILWKQPTGNECWGIDIAKDGSKVAAGCHDGFVYVMDRSGKLLWKYDEKAMVRNACFSPDGNRVLSGTLGTLQLFDSASGAKTEVNRSGDWLRNCAFYPDGSGFVVGSRETGGFSAAGVQKWQYVMGEFPMFLGVDNCRNTYASGKSRTFFSFDENGSVRFTQKITEPAITAGAVAPAAGKIAAGSVGGSVYLFDANGTLLWKRGTLGLGEFGPVGHNAIAISEDGTRVVAGTDSNCIAVYDGLGTLLWKKCIAPDESNPDLKMGVTNVQISPDKSKILAAYGDNYVRMFQMKEQR